MNAKHTPELLEALRECVTDEGAVCFKSGFPDAMERRLHAINEIARAAIKKATGEE